MAWQGNPVESPNKRFTLLPVEWGTESDGTVTSGSVVGVGIESVERSAEGEYTITFNRAYHTLFFFGGSVIGSSEVDYQFECKSKGTSSGVSTIVVRTMDMDSDAAADLDSGEINVLCGAYNTKTNYQD